MALEAFEGNKAGTATMLPVINAFKAAHNLTDAMSSANGCSGSRASMPQTRTGRARRCDTTNEQVSAPDYQVSRANEPFSACACPAAASEAARRRFGWRGGANSPLDRTGLGAGASDHSSSVSFVSTSWRRR